MLQRTAVPCSNSTGTLVNFPLLVSMTNKLTSSRGIPPGLTCQRDLTPLLEQPATGGARRLDRALDDDREERARVVCCRERVAQAADHALHPRPLLGQLLEASLELGCHVVKGAGQDRELVVSAHTHPPLESPLGYCPGCVGELAQ